jgi:hypothetical protein
MVTFGDKVRKIRKYCVIFVYILQGKMGKTEKTERKSCNYSDQSTKNKKTKIWDEQNIGCSLDPTTNYETTILKFHEFFDKLE